MDKSKVSGCELFRDVVNVLGSVNIRQRIAMLWKQSGRGRNATCAGLSDEEMITAIMVLGPVEIPYVSPTLLS